MMKKKIVVFMIIMMIVFSLSTSFALEKEGARGSHKLTRKLIKGGYQVYKKGIGIINVKFLSHLYIDKKTAFCLQPHKNSGDNIAGYSAKDFIASGYSISTRNDLSQIVYCAWDTSKKTETDYLVAKFMIWERLGWKVNSIYGAITLDKYKAKKKVILDKINTMNKKPSFHKKKYTLIRGETIVIEDKNKVLSKLLFKDKESSNSIVINGNKIIKDGNKLIIEAKGSSILDNKLKLKIVPNKYKGASLVYYKNNSYQKVGLFKVLDPVYSWLNLEVKDIKGKIVITKYNEKKDLKLANATFVIKDSKGAIIDTLVTKEDGRAESKELSLEEVYTVVEVESPKGYVLHGKELEVKFDKAEAQNGVVLHNLDVTNKLIQSPVEITKLDISTKQPIPNCDISIFTTDDKLIDIKRTDKNGVAKFANIKYGKYYFIEKNAPKGYLLNKEKHFFEVKENGKVVKSTLEDEVITSNLKILKIDEATKKKLKGCHIEIRDSKTNKVVFKGVTNSKGELKTVLKYGEYTYRERKAPKGYILDKKVRKLRIDGLKKTIVLTLKNKHKPSLPETGSSGLNFGFLTSFIVLLFIKKLF